MDLDYCGHAHNKLKNSRSTLGIYVWTDSGKQMRRDFEIQNRRFRHSTWCDISVCTSDWGDTDLFWSSGTPEQIQLTDLLVPESDLSACNSQAIICTQTYAIYE
jgi:hypothetical protein